jgi:hypothetical protein
MKKLISLILTAITVLGLSAQSATTSPGTGHWVVIDSGYKVETYTVGKTVAPLYFYNTSTSEKITGMQFRIFYDKTAFTAVVPLTFKSPPTIGVKENVRVAGVLANTITSYHVVPVFGKSALI